MVKNTWNITWKISERKKIEILKQEVKSLSGIQFKHFYAG